MKILAFDCSGNGCSAAVLKGAGVAAHEFAAMARGHAEALVPMIERVLKAAGLAPAALDLIAVTRGPGAFTGIRIGLATAAGLALASGVPALGLTTFETVAAAVPEALLGAGALIAAIDSRREELFLQRFDDAREPAGEPALVAPAHWNAWLGAAPVVLAGDGAGRLAAALPRRPFTRAPGSGIPDAADLARLAFARWRPGMAAARLEPLYLRGADTTLANPAAAS